MLRGYKQIDHEIKETEQSSLIGVVQSLFYLH